jgi:hypothetical protein
MILYRNQINELILNINNNTRESFSVYMLRFTHSLSQHIQEYSIDTSDNTVYGENSRYCEIILDLIGPNNLIYEGQYTLEIFGNNSKLVYVTLVEVRTNDDEVFVQYQSNNEQGEQFIYID